LEQLDIWQRMFGFKESIRLGELLPMVTKRLKEVNRLVGIYSHN
jgi:hypothetical protein